MKAYISGKITGSESDAEEKFQDAESKVAAMGLIPVNPMTINHEHDLTWESYMKEDLKALLDCQAIYMLPCWKDSKGATIEHNLALELGLTVIYA
ncbi:DUF4406 domain-containing protein [Niabella insulamsoli]|uniref:DUF4406 domain-containing protein n=1 Tax=Niabella insulamsoli TaxID=3144874 RepID=UPI0031FC76BA